MFDFHDLIVYHKFMLQTKTVTLPKVEYLKLKKQAKAYQVLAGHFFNVRVQEAGSVADVIDDFRKTNLYTPAFLADLQDGLKHSSYAKAR